MANFYGGTGNDTHVGSTGDDQLLGKDGEDSIAGDSGDDQVFGGNDNDTLSGDAGNDRVGGNSGDDTIYGGEGVDELYGDEGNDVIEGGEGADEIYGGTGNDSIDGGAGNDILVGGHGDDRIDGGAGDDTISGADGADTFVVKSAGGQDVITDFEPSEGDVLAINYPGITSYSDLEPYLSDDGNWGTMITFPDGTTTQLESHQYSNLAASQFTFESAPICFLAGTLIETGSGARPVEALAAGDLVETLDFGLQPVRELVRTTFRFGPDETKMKPVCIRAGALGRNAPAQDLYVSPQHRIGWPQNAPVALIPAKKLLGLRGVDTLASCRVAVYVHIVLERHALVRANGSWAESMLLTPYSTGQAGLARFLTGDVMELVRPEVRRDREVAALLGATMEPHSL